MYSVSYIIYTFDLQLHVLSALQASMNGHFIKSVKGELSIHLADVVPLVKPSKRFTFFFQLVEAKQSFIRIHTVIYIVYLMVPKTGY